MNNPRELAYQPGKVRLLKGLAILGGAAVISKLLGTLQKIPLQNLAGDEAYGIYSAVYPFYVLILFLATAGFPIAVSKLVSEQTTVGNWREARRIVNIASFILMITGIVCFAVMYVGAGMIASWMGNAESELAIRSVSFALLIVPAMAALRGYFQGTQYMVPTGVSQVVEQFVRVATMIILLIILTNQLASSGTVAAGATFGSATGALAGLAVMLIYDWRERRRLKQLTDPLPDGEISASRSVLAMRIIRYALPIALGSIVVPILSIIDTFTMPRMLMHGFGWNESQAMHEFGVYSRGLPLVQMVSMLFSSLSVALVPALAEAKMRGDTASIKSRTALSLRVTWFVGIAASVGLALLCVPINIMLYRDIAGSATIAVIAWTGLFSSFNIITASILQGLGAEKLPALHLLYTVVIKVGLNIILVPDYGIIGAAWAAVLAFAAASLLNVLAIRRMTGLRANWKETFLFPGLSLVAMSAFILVLLNAGPWVAEGIGLNTDGRLWNSIMVLVAVSAGAAIYVLALLRTGAVKEDDLQIIPGLHRRIAPWLKKFKILR